MNNWNYESAMAFVDTIVDPVSRNLTSLFLNSAITLATQGKARPAEPFDLLFFVKAVARMTCELALIEKVLRGEELDGGWRAVAEAIDEMTRIER